MSLRYKHFFLFNYDGFHFYEIDVYKQKNTQHVYAEWKNVKLIYIADNRAPYRTIVKLRHPQSQYMEFEHVGMALYVKDFEKYSRRKDICLTRWQRFQKRKHFDKTWYCYGI